MITSTHAPFVRHTNCPHVETLRAYQDSTLSFLLREPTRRHIAACDFCDAALELLSKHAPVSEPPAPEPIPMYMLLLAQTIMPQKTYGERARRKHAA
ncbi:MAG TPA: hypothetical protein VF666_03700 [Pyrinomonadaceae bacterium]|jgi:hypothetical protein